MLSVLVHNMVLSGWKNSVEVELVPVEMQSLSIMELQADHKHIITVWCANQTSRSISTTAQGSVHCHQHIVVDDRAIYWSVAKTRNS